MDGQVEVRSGILDFYNDLYAHDVTLSVDQCLNVIPICVTATMNEKLTSPISDREIEKAIFDLGAYKAPDGLNGLFFQKNWDTVRADVIVVVKDFFSCGTLRDGVNHTLVALIPKIPNLESISNLRPISWCNFIYKIIAKVIVARLKPIMPHIISPSRVFL